MKKTKKESNESKNQKRRKEEGKHKNRSRLRRNALSRGPLFFVCCPVEQTTSVRLLRSVTHNNNNNNNNNNARIKSTQQTRAPTVFVSQTKTESRDKCVKYSLSALFILEVSAKWWWWQQEEIRFRAERKRKDDDENGGNDDNVSPVFFFFEQQLRH